MLEYISEGGWGALPVLLLGLVTLGLSITFAVTLRRELLPLLGGLLFATLLSGCMGTLVGVQATVRYVASRPAYDPALMASGVRESLNVAIIALHLSILATLVSGAGGFRFAWRATARP